MRVTSHLDRIVRKPMKNMEEYKKQYLPRLYTEEKLARMSPEELGRYYAKQSLEKIETNERSA